MTKGIFKTVILLGTLGLSACLSQSTRTSPFSGGSEPSAPAGVTPELQQEGAEAGDSTEVAANQPGPGGSMPSGTLAPAPLVPVNFAYKAAGSYCRFESNPARALIWGKIYRTVGDGQGDAEFGECTDFCLGKTLRLFSSLDGADVQEVINLSDAPEFRFSLDLDDPGKFGLILLTQKTVYIPGQETPPAQGAFVNVSEMKPYAVDGTPAFCPEAVPMKLPIEKSTFQIRAP